MLPIVMFSISYLIMFVVIARTLYIKWHEEYLKDIAEWRDPKNVTKRAQSRERMMMHGTTSTPPQEPADAKGMAIFSAFTFPVWMPFYITYRVLKLVLGRLVFAETPTEKVNRLVAEEEKAMKDFERSMALLNEDVAHNVK